MSSILEGILPEITTTSRTDVFDPIAAYEKYNKSVVKDNRYKGLKVLGLVADDTACNHGR